MEITRTGGGARYRLCQEVMLGSGNRRMLCPLGLSQPGPKSYQTRSPGTLSGVSVNKWSTVCP
jgi:hypothetical protein